MLYVWVDDNNDPDYPKGDRHGVDGYFLPMFGGRPATKARLSDIAGHNRARGIYMASNWTPFLGKTPQEQAQIIVGKYQEVFVPGLRVQIDYEEHDPDKIIAVIEAIRAEVPGMPLSWTMEGFQGGWMKPDFVARVIKAKVRVVPQSYWGAGGTIQGDFAHDMTLRDLMHVGFPETSVSLFYDGKTLPRNAQGYVFTQGRLS